MTSATRSLCVGAYLDNKFRARVLREVYAEGRRALAPSYGFDVVPVLLRCRYARSWIVVRDILLCVCLGLSLLSGFVNTVGVVVLLILWAVAVYLGWLTRVVVGLDRERRVPGRVQAILGFAAFSGWGWRRPSHNDKGLWGAGSEPTGRDRQHPTTGTYTW